jgi:hypothetical protein
MEGGSAVARPRLSASGDRVIVTDPARAQIHVVDSAKMQIVHKVAVPGAPFDVVVVSAAGKITDWSGLSTRRIVRFPDLRPKR